MNNFQFPNQNKLTVEQQLFEESLNLLDYVNSTTYTIENI